MKIVMLACTARGFAAARRCREKLAEKLPEAEILTDGHCAHVPGYEDGPKLSELTSEWFAQADALIFFTATGIAVRCIAPCVRDKFRDPAVLVIDENSRFVISLLSGHAGGANRLCLLLADLLGAQPVITTATDGRGLFAVDVFATENGFQIGDRKRAKQVSARLLAGEEVLVFSDSSDTSASPKPEETTRLGRSGNRLPGEEECMLLGESGNGFSDGSLPVLLERYGRGAKETADRARADIILSFRRLPEDSPEALYLIPRVITLGIGCRKGVSSGRIRDAVSNVLEKNGILPRAVCGIASIDLKKEEAGLLQFAGETGLPAVFYTAQELQSVPGCFTASPFVREITGVENVCERSAVLLAGENGKLLIGKQREEGVTVAVGLARPAWKY